MKHTPGPWTIVVPPSSSGFGRAIYRTTDDSPDQFVAYVGNWSQPPHIEVADASVIAAAPEMLAALKAAVADFEADYDWPTIDAMRAAIAKAEGR